MLQAPLALWIKLFIQWLQCQSGAAFFTAEKFTNHTGNALTVGYMKTNAHAYLDMLYCNQSIARTIQFKLHKKRVDLVTDLESWAFSDNSWKSFYLNYQNCNGSSLQWFVQPKS